MKTISHKDFQKLLWEHSYRNAIPASNIFELTPLCNLDCKMCYVHLQDSSLKDRIIRKDQWLAIMDEAIDLGMISAILTGGEAMSHPEFWDIYMYLVNRGISLSVKTNGILLNDRAIAVFKQYPPSTIDISIYGCDREIYLHITGHDMFETVDRNIHAALEAGLPLRFMITPSGLMGTRIEDIMRYAMGFHMKTVINTQLLDPHEDTGRKKEDFDLSVDEMIAIRKKANELFPRETIVFDEEPSDQNHSFKEETSKDGLRCIAGRSHFAISWDGVMTPCITFPRDAISASVTELGVTKAWQTIHEAVVSYSRPKACSACTYQDRCHYCPSNHGRYAVNHTCNPMSCALEQRMIDTFRTEERKEQK